MHVPEQVSQAALEYSCSLGPLQWGTNKLVGHKVFSPPGALTDQPKIFEETPLSHDKDSVILSQSTQDNKSTFFLSPCTPNT